jgi:2-amino-4-hydroxy-6-hydroxymethyldihydropteridine diphosphokinase
VARVFIGLGSNVGNRAAHLERARVALGELPSTRLLAFSRIYETDPVGPVEQGRFLNAAAEIETSLEPLDLLRALRDMEAGEGRPDREHRVRWGPRTLDLDILLYDRRVLDAPELSIPHPRMHERAFVLRPLAELDPDALHPVLGKSVGELLRALDAAPGA